MENFFKELRRETQTNYGGYCNQVRANGIEPVPYHVFAKKFHFEHKSKWLELTNEIHAKGE